jgi:hypothetical protein
MPPHHGLADSGIARNCQRRWPPAGGREKATHFGNLGIAPDRLWVHFPTPKQDVTRPDTGENQVRVKDNGAGDPQTH